MVGTQLYSCVPTLYLLHFSDYIIDEHNGDDSPQTWDSDLLLTDNS